MILQTDGWEDEGESSHVLEANQHQIKFDYSVRVSIVDGFQNQLEEVFSNYNSSGWLSLYIDLLCFRNV